MTESTSSEAAWYCVKTQTKRESIAAAHLRGLEGVEVFCPMLRYRKATRRGKVWWVEALFPAYVLARFRLETEERAVMYCQGVRGLVRFGDRVPAVPDDFVEVLRQEVAKQGGDEVLTVGPKIVEGEEVELAHGPLGGVRATVVEVLPARERVKVLLEFLGREQVIEVDLFSLLLPRKPLP
ncbi:transcription termination/antitermination protein NusG [Luteolibacter marinus]|uniref:transcription termination/antitermination protein NusG n=1 Tax=Luteolibacter marinus TaxID=2776705 RepID=UPI001868AC1F|nr:transcription termination/antitermination NusG family protein [Luteolibacter marinus]